MMSFTKTLFALSALVAPLLNVASAAMVPTSPDSSTVVEIGANLTALWTKDTTGTWSSVTLQLMSGDNYDMIPVTTIATQIDATSIASYTFVVPDVTPTSKIYFLQFTPATGNSSDVTWTTRFTIAATDGSTTTPANSTQPNGDAIPWGVGTLVSSDSTSTANSTTVAAVTSSASTSTAATTSAEVESVVAATTSSTATAMITTTSAAATTTKATTATAAAASATASTGASSQLQVGIAGGILGGMSVLMALML